MMMLDRRIKVEKEELMARRRSEEVIAMVVKEMRGLLKRADGNLVGENFDDDKRRRTLELKEVITTAGEEVVRGITPPILSK